MTALADDLTKSLFDELAGNAEIASGVSARIFPDFAPTSATLPYLVYQSVAGTSERHTTGRSGLAEATFQIDTYAVDSPAVIDVSDAVKRALDGYVGSISGAWGAVDVRGVGLDNERKTIDRLEDASQNVTFRVSQDYTIHYRRS